MARTCREAVCQQSSWADTDGEALCQHPSLSKSAISHLFGSVYRKDLRASEVIAKKQYCIQWTTKVLSVISIRNRNFISFWCQDLLLNKPMSVKCLSVLEQVRISIIKCSSSHQTTMVKGDFWRPKAYYFKWRLHLWMQAVEYEIAKILVPFPSQ